jgi:AraC family transcriptional regulator
MMAFNTETPLQEQTIEQAVGGQYVGHGQTPWLSIKCMFNGEAYYEMEEGGRYLVDDNHYLILNQNHPYWIHKPAARPVETFVIFFPPHWANALLYSLVAPIEHLLDSPVAPNEQPIQFVERVYPHDTIVTPQLQKMRALAKNGRIPPTQLEEELHHLLTRMMVAQQNILLNEVEQLAPARQATRLELYRRLHIARDYIHASLSEAITLHDIAQAAALSPHHFLRAFKKVFGQTPHAYLTQLRLQKAKQLLRQTQQPVTDICFAVGFHSLGSFSTLFQRHTGCSPRAFRQQSC